MGTMGERDVTVFYDERMLAHCPDVNNDFLPGRLDRRIKDMIGNLTVKWAYPEIAGRLTAVMELLEREPVPGVKFEPGVAATPEQLARVHTSLYVESILELRGKSAWLDVDTTSVSPGSVEAAEVAAGSAIAAAEAVCEGRTGSAFALVRPPGHHAEPVRARGFCLFNNVAVAAAHAQAKLGCKRVLIVDWDAHHGNGTQDIFWAEPDVMFFDTHRSAPFYPGSGLIEEVGAGLGEGLTVNVPVPGGSGDPAMAKAFREVLVPAADDFRPDLVLVSAGFDPHRLDLTLNMSEEGFGVLTGIVQDIADRHCDGRLAMVLEGGYHWQSLSFGVRSVLQVLAGADPPEPQVPGFAEVEAAAYFHSTAFKPAE
ncbi:MAG: histone deacetylase [Actinobacteria bacterium]|nr:histone deacetylase [Actinomycetota bacterium]